MVQTYDFRPGKWVSKEGETQKGKPSFLYYLSSPLRPGPAVGIGEQCQPHPTNQLLCSCSGSVQEDWLEMEAHLSLPASQLTGNLRDKQVPVALKEAPADCSHVTHT